MAGKVIRSPFGVKTKISSLNKLDLKSSIKSNASLSLFSINSLISWIHLSKPELLTEVIGRCVKLKADVVVEDEREGGKRRILNFGHTIGHAVESYSILSKEINKLKHGEAIAVGLITELYISHKIHGFDYKNLLSIKKELLGNFKKISFTTSDQKEIFKIMSYDKKNYNNKVKYVLLKGIGNPIIDQDVDNELFFKAFDFYNE